MASWWKSGSFFLCLGLALIYLLLITRIYFAGGRGKWFLDAKVSLVSPCCGNFEGLKRKNNCTNFFSFLFLYVPFGFGFSLFFIRSQFWIVRALNLCHSLGSMIAWFLALTLSLILINSFFALFLVYFRFLRWRKSMVSFLLFVYHSITKILKFWGRMAWWILFTKGDTVCPNPEP